MKDVVHPQSVIQLSGSKALQAALAEFPKEAGEILECLLEIYREKLAVCVLTFCTIVDLSHLLIMIVNVYVVASANTR